MPARRAAVARRSHADGARRRSLGCPIWPTSAGSRSGASLWRWRRLGATTSSCSARRAPARRCSPRGCPASSRRSPTAPPSRPPASTPPPVSACRRAGWCASRRSGRPTTARRRSRWSAAAAPTMRPGEISAACNGVLFLDELAEFAQHVLDALRQPLEEGVVRVARAAGTVTFPARFLLVAAMNPCPCGYGGRPGGCRCTDGARARYQRRLSGPLLDRFDLRVEVTRPSVSDLMGTDRSEPTAVGARAGAGGAGAVAAERGVAHQRRHPGRPARRARPAPPRRRRRAGPSAQERPALRSRAAPRAAGRAHGRRPAGAPRATSSAPPTSPSRSACGSTPPQHPRRPALTA